MNLWVFGDSYSTPNFCVEPQDSFWGLSADYLGVSTIMNYSWPGNNWESIQHMVVSMRNDFGPDDYVIVGIPPIERLTVFDPNERVYYGQEFTNTFNPRRQLRVTCHESLEQNTTHALNPEAAKFYNRTWRELEVMRSVITLSTWLRMWAIKSIIVNLSEPFSYDTGWSTAKQIINQCQEINELLLFENTYYSINHYRVRPVDFDTHGWFGHHGADGNFAFFEQAILPKLREI